MERGGEGKERGRREGVEGGREGEGRERRGGHWSSGRRGSREGEERVSEQVLGDMRGRGGGDRIKLWFSITTVVCHCRWKQS